MLKIYIFLSTIIFLLAPILGAICPLEDNVVCNHNVKQHRCVCAVPAKTENPVPEQSCNKVVDVNDEDFEGISVVFNLDEAAERFDNFSQADFREEVADVLRINEDQIIILRISCQDDDEKLAVQFVVLKDDVEKIEETSKKSSKKVTDEDDDDEDKDAKTSAKKSKEEEDDDEHDDKDDEKDEEEKEHKHSHGKHDHHDDEDDEDDKKSKSKSRKDSEEAGDNDDEENEDDEEEEHEHEPYKPEAFLDAKKVMSELTVAGKESQMVDMDVDDIEVVHDLYAIEASSDNTFLLFEALAVVLGITLTCFLGCYFTCKKCRKQDEYLDTLQKV